MQNIARCNAYQGHCRLCMEENGPCPNKEKKTHDNEHRDFGAIVVKISKEQENLPFA